MIDLSMIDNLGYFRLFNISTEKSIRATRVLCIITLSNAYIIYMYVNDDII